jgi:uncharacterized membrane protein YfhO
LHVEKNSNYKPSPLKNYQDEVSEDVSAFEQFKTPEKDKDVFADEDVLNAKKQTDFTVKSKLEKVFDIKSIRKSLVRNIKKDFKNLCIQLGNERKSAKLLHGRGKLIDLRFEEDPFSLYI